MHHHDLIRALIAALRKARAEAEANRNRDLLRAHMDAERIGRHDREGLRTQRALHAAEERADAWRYATEEIDRLRRQGRDWEADRKAEILRKWGP